MSAPPLVVVCGPTASRKSELGLGLAEALDGELVCCDSVQVYRGFRIGSAAPSDEELGRVPHHLFGVFPADDPADAGRWARLADEVIASIRARGRRPIVVGGTGLYLRALLHGLAPVPAVSSEVRERLVRELAEQGKDALFQRLQTVDPELAERIEGGAANTQRVLRGLEVFEASGVTLSAHQAAWQPVPRYDAVLLMPVFPPEVLNRRIDERVEAMFASGLEDEVRGLLASGVPPTCRPMESLGYRQVAACLAGELTREEAIDNTRKGHRAYAKRQRTWFKAVEDVVRVDGEAEELVEQALAVIQGAAQ